MACLLVICAAQPNSIAQTFAGWNGPGDSVRVDGVELTINASPQEDFAKFDNYLRSGPDSAVTITFTFSSPVTAIDLWINLMETNGNSLTEFSIPPSHATEGFEALGSPIESVRGRTEVEGHIFWRNLQASEISFQIQTESAKPVDITHLAWSTQPSGTAVSPQSLPHTEPLTLEENLSLRIKKGVHDMLLRKTDESPVTRQKYWNRDYSSAEAYVDSIAINRRRLAEMLGIESRTRLASNVTPDERWGAADGIIGEGSNYRISQVQWQIYPDGVQALALLLRPHGEVKASVIAVPDVTCSAEQCAGLASGVEENLQFARRLAESGVEVLVPIIINTAVELSVGARPTNQTHREWLHRQGWESGHHLIGIEVDAMRAAIDWIRELRGANHPVGIAGRGEGGLLAMYAAAIDQRIDTTLVSGYFGRRENLRQEPFYRSVWGLLKEFGDAEIVSLIAPRSVVIEHAAVDTVDAAPIPNDQLRAATPGVARTRERHDVTDEFERLTTLVPEVLQNRFLLSDEVQPSPGISEAALDQFLELLVGSGVEVDSNSSPVDGRATFSDSERMAGLFDEMQRYLQNTIIRSPDFRDGFFHDRVDKSSLSDFQKDVRQYRKYFSKNIVGEIDDEYRGHLHARSRKIIDMAAWTGYEILLSVYEGVEAWAYLLIPKALAPGERRPVVVCQHGLGSLPEDVVFSSSAKWYYKSFAARLADRGYIVLAPHNLYTFQGITHLEIARIGIPLGMTIFAPIIRQHQQMLDYLENLPCADASRIGFYGLSYGGVSAVSIPPEETRYCFSICSANWANNALKNCYYPSGASYMNYPYFQIYRWSSAATIGYAEQAALISPRPFMVERGVRDPVAGDSWVTPEFSKAKTHYADLGLDDQCLIEYFDGGHEINAKGTFELIDREFKERAPEIVTFQASSFFVSAGDEVELAWQYSGFDCSVTMEPRTTDATVGQSVRVNPDATTTYVLQVQNEYGVDTRELTVFVDRRYNTIVDSNARKDVFVPESDITHADWLAQGDAPVSFSTENIIGYDLDGFFPSNLELADNVRFRDLMVGRNASIYSRIAFDLKVSAAPIERLVLAVRYDDGFVAFLNGDEIARRSAPGEVTWCSEATGTHGDDNALEFEYIDITSAMQSLEHLDNLLSFHGLNYGERGGDFILDAQLLAVTTETPYDKWAAQYFTWEEMSGNGSGGRYKDHDDDLLPNLVEFAFKTDPTRESGAHASLEWVTDDVVEFSYPRRKGGTGRTAVDYTVDEIVYSLEFSEVPRHDQWQALPFPFETLGFPQDMGDGLELVTLRANIADFKRGFFRLKVTPVALFEG